MIIVGDIASPSIAHSDRLRSFFKDHDNIFRHNSLICNFEGPISTTYNDSANTPILYNDPSVVAVLKEANLVGVCLANNHTLDLPDCFDCTVQTLKNAGVNCVGAGRSSAEAERPIVYTENEIEVVIFNFCWSFLLYHQQNPSNGVFIAELNELKLIKTIQKMRLEKPLSKVVVNLHWSFDLETLPFPSYRQFAKLLIEAGATIVAGCHSHCVQGGEIYQNGYIIYGLGNFFIPHNVFANGQIKYPEMSKVQLAFEYDFTHKVARCHWFEYDEQQHVPIRYVKTEDFRKSELLGKYSPYASMDQKEYKTFFKKNRRKNFLVPVYSNIYNKTQNSVFTYWLKLRATLLRTLAKYKLRSWQN